MSFSKQSILIILILTSFINLKSTDFHAVCVGINEYYDYYYNVGNCKETATDMKTYLVNYQGWNDYDITLLTNEEAKKSTILAKIDAMPNSTGNSNLFHYEGHGNQEGLMPHDYNSGGNGGFIITPEDIEDAFGNNYNQFAMFIGACHSGLFVNEIDAGEISSTCKEDGVGHWDGPAGHTVYGHYILEGIKNSKADPLSGHVVSVEEVHNYAEHLVESHHGSKPQFESNLGVFNLQQLGPTSSGTINDSELWDEDVQLNGDVVVSSGKKIAIYDSDVNLNGHYIKLNSGAKVVLSGNVNIFPNPIIIYEGDTKKGFYTSLCDACDNDTNGQKIIVDSDITVPSNQNVTVTNGATLTINPGKTINFGQNSHIIVESNGRIDALGTSSNRINFNFTGQTGGITLYNYCEFEHVNISNANTGMHIRDCNYEFSTVHDVNFTNNSIGLKVTNTISGSDQAVEVCKFQNNSDYGIYLDNSESILWGSIATNDVIDNSNIGVMLSNSSELRSYDYNFTNNNKGIFVLSNCFLGLNYDGGYLNVIRDNNYGVYINYGGDGNLNGRNQDNDPNYFDSNTSYDIYNANSPTVYGKYNYWFSPPKISNYVDITPKNSNSLYKTSGNTYQRELSQADSLITDSAYSEAIDILDKVARSTVDEPICQRALLT